MSASAAPLPRDTSSGASLAKSEGAPCDDLAALVPVRDLPPDPGFVVLDSGETGPGHCDWDAPGDLRCAGAALKRMRER
jgi:hypothetical protein